jgi:mono/diheme cytochrome c family protein/glucose/arabinose dehydrogenase
MGIVARSVAAALFGVSALAAAPAGKIDPAPGSRIVLVGGGQGERLLHDPAFETELQRRFAGRNLVVRNLCDDGDTPGYRDHSGRNSPYAFPGAERWHPLSRSKDTWGSGQAGSGFAKTPDQWLAALKVDVVLAWFGFGESFAGAAGLDGFRAELTAWLDHMASQRPNGKSAPRIVLITPSVLEERSAPQGEAAAKAVNANLALYAGVMREVAAARGLGFADLHALSREAFAGSREALTRDGMRWNERGHARLAPALVDAVFAAGRPRGDVRAVAAAVSDKDWHWEKLHKVPNGVHAHGRRHHPFGPDNFPAELAKLEALVANRDRAIWAAATGASLDLAAADAGTSPLPEVRTNYTPNNGKNGRPTYLGEAESLAALTLAPGYKAQLFASEASFPDLINPVRVRFDTRGRLWVATMPSYPQWRPGDARPDDKILILEDTDGDGRADRQTIFARGLHLPLSFEFAPEGVYVAQGQHLVLLRDADGDGRADRSEIVLSGFDDHDTHHAIGAFASDPSGAFYLAEGTFLHSHVETPRGVVRSTNGGFFRFDPRTGRLERTARLSIPNPWGAAFDAHGQDFFLDTSDPGLRWMAPATLAVPFGEFAPLPPDLAPREHRVRPTAGLEFVSSRHFPDETQGDVLLSNTIGFLGAKQHKVEEDGTGYRLSYRQDLYRSSDGNFRPVAMEFAPDGSLYVADWHNALIGHMQHSARDPLRDKAHGRIFRITYPARPLLKPAAVAGAPVEALLENLRLPEQAARSRTRLELRGRDAGEVQAALGRWLARLDAGDAASERLRLEGLWVSWGIGRLDAALLRSLLQAKDHRVRAAAVRVLRYASDEVPDAAALLAKAAADPHGRVRLEAVTASTWMTPEVTRAVLAEARRQPVDNWLRPVVEAAETYLKGGAVAEAPAAKVSTDLKGEEARLYELGAEVYRREAHCVTCHQADGLGLPAAQFPPLAKSIWVTGRPERLIRLTLHGLMGPIEVNGVKYPGQVPMTAFKGLSDREIAGVLTYVRNSFGNRASGITPEQVAKERAATRDQQRFLVPADLLREFPDGK